MRVAEPDVLPGVAGVAAAVDAVAGEDVAANAGLAGADEDEVGVGFGDRDRADRGRGDLEVGDGVPVFAAVGGLPEAAAGGAEVGLLGAAFDTAGRDGAAAAIGAEVAPCVGGEEGGGEGDGLLGVEGGGGGARRVEARRRAGIGVRLTGVFRWVRGGVGRVNLPGGWRLGQAGGGAPGRTCG